MRMLFLLVISLSPGCTVGRTQLMDSSSSRRESACPRDESCWGGSSGDAGSWVVAGTLVAAISVLAFDRVWARLSD